MSETTSEWSTPLHKPKSPHISEGSGGPRPTFNTAAPNMFNGAAPSSRPAPASHDDLIGMPLIGMCPDCGKTSAACSCC